MNKPVSTRQSAVAVAPSADLQATSIHIHIDRIVVDGLKPSSRQSFARALHEKLAGMETERIFQGAPTDRHRIDSLDAGLLLAHATPEQAAEQVVAALRRALLGSREDKRHG